MKEIVSMHIGQAGTQLGNAVWELLTAEHSVDRGGTTDPEEWQSRHTFFSEATSGKAVPRAIFVDLEPTVIDQIRKGSYSCLFNPTQLINGGDDSSSNFSRAYYTVGRLLYGVIDNQIRKQIESCEYIQAILLFRSLAGGTGSGLTSMIFEILEEYSKTIRIEFPIHPSPHFDSTVVGPYNSILAEHFCLEQCDVGLLFDNEALFDICSRYLEINNPTMTTINRLLAQVCSSITAATRFHNNLCNDVTVVLTNLVPYPRIHFPLVSYAPLGNSKNLEYEENTCIDLTKSVFDKENQLVKCNPSNGKYMTCSLVYRGLVSPSEIYSTLGEIKKYSKYRFVDWCPTGFKIGIVDQPPLILPNSNLGVTNTNVVMMTNCSSVSVVWHRLALKFHKLYAKRSFVHWFVGEGLEENEFCDALYNLATLAKDYEEVSLDSNMLDNIMVEESTKKTEDKAEGNFESSVEVISMQESNTEEEDSDDDDTNESNANRNCNYHSSFHKKKSTNMQKSNEIISNKALNYKLPCQKNNKDIEMNSDIDTSKLSVNNIILSTLKSTKKQSLDEIDSRKCTDIETYFNSKNDNKCLKSKLPVTVKSKPYTKSNNDDDIVILEKLVSFTSNIPFNNYFILQ